MRELTLLLSFSVKYRPDLMSTSQSSQSVATTESRTLLYKEVRVEADTTLDDMQIKDRELPALAVYSIADRVRNLVWFY